MLESTLSDYSLLDNPLETVSEGDNEERKREEKALEENAHVATPKELIIATTLVGKSEEGRRVKRSRDCAGEEASALYLIAQCYTDSDDDSTIT